MSVKVTATKKLRGFTVVSKKKSATWFNPNWNIEKFFSKSMAVSPQAQKLIKARPTLPKEVFWSFLKLKKGSMAIVSREGLLFKKLDAKGSVGNHFFKLNVGKKSFFVKVIENKRLRPNFLPHYDLAFSQFRALNDAKKTLNKLPNHLKGKFSVVSPEFAFVSGKYSFLVTDFVKLKTVEQILIEKKGLYKEVSNSIDHFKEGSKFLRKSGFVDVLPHNTFYSPTTKKFILFDVRKTYDC